MQERITKTLFARVDSIFIANRAITILGIAVWTAFVSNVGFNLELARWLLAGFGVHLILFYLFSCWKKISRTRLYQATLFLDLSFITTLVHATGGLSSDFYLFYYLAISFGAFYHNLRFGLVLALFATAFYLTSNLSTLSEIFFGDLGIRIFFFWFFAVAVGVISRYLKSSEERLLRALDTLNERTTELERSQVQLETMYETSRALGEIHDLEGVLDEILNITRRVMGYPACAVMLLNAKEDRLLLKARMESGEKKTYKDPPVVELEGIIGQVVKTGRSERVFDTELDPRYVPGLRGARSQMVVPMTSRGTVIGVLSAESRQVGAFLDKDQKIFSILANSAAMALENAVMHKQMEQMSTVDPLTGVYNFRYFNNKLIDELKRSRRYRQPVSLIMIDIDYFKKANDRFGHQIGNAVLNGLVEVIQRCIRDTDTLVRYGGDEFVVVLPQTDKRDAFIIGERIRSTVAETVFGGLGDFPELRITVSIGITTWPDNGYAEHEIVKVADQALYRAKGSGRNHVCTI
ncbi:MAG TPA: sensor domain-containing diguanylate cyclase [candidate division Zixibacteria bacterium]|nr:sensor domain-containing diguanylate cyclase [candidate division Zixibacteria bacterium]